MSTSQWHDTTFDHPTLNISKPIITYIAYSTVAHSDRSIYKSSVYVISTITTHLHVEYHHYAVIPITACQDIDLVDFAIGSPRCTQLPGTQMTNKPTNHVCFFYLCLFIFSFFLCFQTNPDRENKILASDTHTFGGFAMTWNDAENINLEDQTLCWTNNCLQYNWHIHIIFLVFCYVTNIRTEID